MTFTNDINPTLERQPRGGALDLHWPRIPVCHLAFETDSYFTTIDCLNA